MEEKMRNAFKKGGQPFPVAPKPTSQPYAGNQPASAARPAEPVKMELPEDYVAQAERVMTQLLQNSLIRQSFTTSKIRNILSMVSELFNELQHERQEALSPELVERVRYLRVRLVYESGREPAVGTFVRGAKLVEYLRAIDGSRSKFIRYARYMEALVAYHRFLGGKDK